MELNDESEEETALNAESGSAADEAGADSAESTGGDAEGADAEGADVEGADGDGADGDGAGGAEAGPAADETETADEPETDTAGRAASSGTYSAPYEPAEAYDEDKKSLLKRLSPYLTVAGILLILRIVVYSLRRRRK